MSSIENLNIQHVITTKDIDPFQGNLAFVQFLLELQDTFDLPFKKNMTHYSSVYNFHP
jgi:hypothetical protein